MKKFFLLYLLVAMSLFTLPVFSQTEQDPKLLGLPGDNLDLYAVLDLFQRSKTIEEFEKSLNEQKTGINNLDLDLDKKVDFIKVVTEKKGDAYTFILQVAVSKTETQDVAVILVDKDKNKKVTLQIIGDEELYGKNYIVEPKTTATPAVTANPAYAGSEPVAKNVSAQPVVIVETVPIVQYVYSPVYVPYVPPYYYGFYPPYFAAFTVMAVGIYHHNNYHYHGYGYHNTVVIHHSSHYNNYNNIRHSSTSVAHHNANGNYGNRPSTHPSNGGASASTRPSHGASASTRPSNGASASTRQSNGASASTRQSNGPSASTRQSASNFSSPRSTSMGEGRSRSGGGGGYSGGGRSGGGGRRR